VLHDISLRIASGEHIAILGPNGCGKSTLIKTMTCECYPIAGEGVRARIFGRERWDVFELRKRLGVVAAEFPSERTLHTLGRDAVITGFFSSSTIWPELHVTEAMRERAAAVLDHLGIERAHVVGASMGGMIAQVFAVRFAERTRSLAVIFSSNNRPFLPPPAPRALLAVLKGPPPGSPLNVIIDNVVRVTKITGSPRYRAPEEQVRAEAIEGYERSYYPWGVARHFSAIMASGSLLGYNRRTVAPTVVIHGRADKLMPPSGGRAVARAINGARLVLFDGMGHDLPQQLWGRLISVLTSNFAEAS